MHAVDPYPLTSNGNALSLITFPERILPAYDKTDVNGIYFKIIYALCRLCGLSLVISSSGVGVVVVVVVGEGRLGWGRKNEKQSFNHMFITDYICV